MHMFNNIQFTLIVTILQMVTMMMTSSSVDEEEIDIRHWSFENSASVVEVLGFPLPPPLNFYLLLGLFSWHLSGHRMVSQWPYTIIKFTLTVSPAHGGIPILISKAMGITNSLQEIINWLINVSYFIDY